MRYTTFSGGWLYEVRFADGTVWPRHNINAVAERVVGTDGDDSLRGYDNTNDTLVGGRGNDTLAGGEGSDTFVWNVGDGNDRILDASWKDGDTPGDF